MGYIMKQISSKTVQILCAGSLSLAIAASPPIHTAEAFAASDSVSSSYSVNALSVDDRQLISEPQPIHSQQATDSLILGVGVVLGVTLLFVGLSRGNSRQASHSNHLAHPSSRDSFNSAGIWSTMQATNDLSSSTSIDCSTSSNANTSSSSDCGGGSWSGGDCGGSSWSGGDSGGSSSGGGGC
jgi:hypothetical protein